MNPKRRQELQEQLSAYLDGELAPEERQEVEAFLAEDAQGRALLDELQATVNMVQSMSRAKASADLMEDIRAKMERRALLDEVEPTESSMPRSYRFSGRLMAAAAVIVFSFVAAYIMRSITDRDTQPDSMRDQYVLQDEEGDKVRETRDVDELAKEVEILAEQDQPTAGVPPMKARGMPTEMRTELKMEKGGEYYISNDVTNSDVQLKRMPSAAPPPGRHKAGGKIEGEPAIDREAGFKPVDELKTKGEAVKESRQEPEAIKKDVAKVPLPKRRSDLSAAVGRQLKEAAAEIESLGVDLTKFSPADLDAISLTITSKPAYAGSRYGTTITGDKSIPPSRSPGQLYNYQHTVFFGGLKTSTQPTSAPATASSPTIPLNAPGKQPNN
ncbi:MAG: zf-HC2 domain-containing protein [Planctomycetota bacterium]|nr:MAG: zf-HC2 domain-containing protein [Planctomycetota bacterium]